MKPTGERHIGDDFDRVEDAILDARHRFAYQLVREVVDPTDQVLEVGFGQGYGADVFGDHVRVYEGLEVDPEALDHAAATTARDNARFQVYDGVNMPFEDGAFDVVFALQVIEHVAALELWLAEIDRVCRPGGTILFTTPNRTHRVMDGKRPWNRFHLVEWTPDEFEEVLATQFADVDVTGISGTPEINEIELRRVRRLRRIARLDPLRLRERLPAAWVHRLSAALGQQAQRSETLTAQDMSLASFNEHRDGVEDSLDLVGRITH